MIRKVVHEKRLAPLSSLMDWTLEGEGEKMVHRPLLDEDEDGKSPNMDTRRGCFCTTCGDAYIVLSEVLGGETHLGGPPHAGLDVTLGLSAVVREHTRLVDEHPN